MKEKKREYTDLQQRFLDLFMEPEFGGDIRKAMKAAGYNDSTRIADVVNSLHVEMTERAQRVLATYGMKAVFKLNEAIDDPNQLGVANKIKAANSVLDRLKGFSNKDEPNGDRISISGGGLIILPAKGNLVKEVSNGNNDTDEGSMAEGDED